jgi:phosphate-selective porin OprO/OprP
MFKGRLIPILGISLVGWTALASWPVEAANEAMMELLKVLRENGTLSEEAYEQLQSAAKADDESNTQGQAEVKAAAQNLPKIDTKGKLEIGTPDGEFKFQAGGRLQVDSAWYEDDESDTGESTELDSATEIRRARIHLAGTLWKYWDFKTEFDFAENAVEIKDAYIAYTGLKLLSFQAGNFKEPFSLEQLTSSRFITFMERSLADIFVPERNLGTQIHYAGPNWTAAAGVFSEGIDDDEEDLVPNGGEGLGATGRVTFAPIASATQVVHLGGAVSWRDPEEDTVEFEQRPESHIADQTLVSTGEIGDIDDFLRYGAEAALVWGPFSLQGEYIFTDLYSDVGEDLDFEGYYIYGSYFITGESRAYKVEKGAFDRITPKASLGKGGWGAWEVAVRYSGLDLSDGPIDGGEEENITAALNWYPTANVRLMANVVHVLDLKGGDFGGANPTAYQMRAQIDF